MTTDVSLGNNLIWKIWMENYRWKSITEYYNLVGCK